MNIEAFIITNGRSTYTYCSESIREQTMELKFRTISNKRWVEALGECFLSCNSDFFLRVDDDFILHPRAVEFMWERMCILKNVDKLGMFFSHLWEDWTEKRVAGIKIYSVKALDAIRGFKVDKFGKVDKVTNEVLEKAGFLLVKDVSAVGLHSCGAWEEQLEYERLWSELAGFDYKKSTHEEMKNYDKPLEEQYRMRLDWLENKNKVLRTPFGKFLERKRYE